VGILSTIFGGTKTAEEATKLVADSVRGVGNWIDEQQLTEQERLEYAAKAQETYLRLVELINQENSVRSVTRRILAWGITAFILLNAQIAVAVSLLRSKLPDGFADKFIDDVLKITTAFGLDWAFTAVVALYFGMQIFRSKAGGGKN